MALTDATGATPTTYTYAPFGDTAVTGTPSGSPFQFTGRENDGTGLYYYRARYYDPTRGRFVSEDAIGLRGGINLYRHAADNPINATPSRFFKPCKAHSGLALGHVEPQQGAPRSCPCTLTRPRPHSA